MRTGAATMSIVAHARAHDAAIGVAGITATHALDDMDAAGAGDVFLRPDDFAAMHDAGGLPAAAGAGVAAIVEEAP
jgi:hypothetical protein